MALVNNSCTLIGWLPSSEKININYTEGNNNKKSFYSTILSVKKSYKSTKDEGPQYSNFRIKAFGATADYLNTYANRGDKIIIHGALALDDNYENSNGEVVYGQPFVAIESVDIIGNRNNNNTTTNNTTNTAKPATQNKASMSFAALKEKLNK